MKKQHAIKRPGPKRRYRILISGVLATGLAASVSIAVTAAQPSRGSRGNYGVVSSVSAHPSR